MFNTYVTSNHKLKTCAHIVLTDCEVEWGHENVTIDRNMMNGEKESVAEMSMKWSKGGLTDFST